MKHIRFKYQISTEGITPPPFYCINHCKSVDYPPPNNTGRISYDLYRHVYIIH